MRRKVTALVLMAVPLFALVTAASPASAQEMGRVTGVVRAADTQRPLSGAQVYIQGTRIGALTNADGRFLIINVPVGTHEVAVLLIGYSQGVTTVTVGAGQTATADFLVSETAISLEGIVVTGTAAEVRAREVANSLDAVTSRELENIPVTNAEDILGGRIPGLTVLQGNGQPGAGSTVRIRSQTTVSSTTDPLIYVDGIRIFHETVGTQGGARLGLSPLQDISAEDIERIEVIKGASAATLYGTEAAGGVIQIFTKRGISGAPIWTAQVTGGFNNQPPFNIGGDPWDLFTKCDGQMYGIGMTKSTYGQEMQFRDPSCPASGRWFQNGLVQRYSVSVRGGSGGVNYYISTNYNNEEGTLPTQQARLGGVRANLDFSPREGLKVQFNSAISMRDLSFVEDGNSMRGFMLNVGRGYSGNYLGRADDERCASINAAGQRCFTNEFIWVDAHNKTRTDRFTTGLLIQHDASESLTNRLHIGWDYDQINNRRSQDWGAVLTPLGNYANAITYHTKLSLDYAGSYMRPFGESLMSTFSWGGQLFRDNHRYTSVSTSDFAGPGVPTLSSGGRAPGRPTDNPFTQTNAGFFLQEVLGYNDLLFLNLGLRVDGNSAFGDNFGLQKYPKAGLAYVISDHDFWPTDWFETMKLRGAYGLSGKAPGAFDKLQTWSPVSDDGSPGFSPRDVGNADVGPERTREVEVGFDASMWQGLVGIEATYYNAKTSDALVGVSLPGSEGGWGTRTENVGELMAEGLEFQLTAALYRSDFIEWRVRGNLAFSRSEALDLNCVDLDGEESCQNIAVSNKARIVVGQPVPAYWGYQILNPNEHAAPIRSDTAMAVGPVMPTRLLGFSTSVQIGDHITLDALLEHQGGHYLPNYTGYQNGRRGVWFDCYEIQRVMADVYNGGNASQLDPYTALERGRCATNVTGGASSANQSGHSSDYWIDKADFWKLRSISVSYQLPEAWVRSYADRATLTLAGRNLLKWTDYQGTDPEIEDYRDRAGSGSGAGDYGRREYYNLPPSRSFLASFRVTF